MKTGCGNKKYIFYEGSHSFGCLFILKGAWKMWRLVILRWDSFVLSIGSIIYGIQLYVHPSILQNYKVYQLIREMFDHRVIGIIFFIIGVLKLIGVITNNERLKFFSVRGLMFLWLLFMVSFLITPPPNTVWIMALMATSLGLGIIIREE